MIQVEKDKKIQDLPRTITWREGLYIASGVPLLVLPSIGFFGTTVWGFSIVIWIISVLQGFFQCTAYAEMATIFKDKAGLPGFVYEAFRHRNKMIPAIAAWGYWFSWTPVVAIMSLLLGSYIQGIFFPQMDAFILSVIFGTLLIAILVIINYFGLVAGAYIQLILAVMSLIPLIGLSMAPFFMGLVDYSNFTEGFLPPDWNWFSLHSWFIIIGLLALGQWSACAWETAATYASEYKNPLQDTPKAIFSAGALCLFVFPLAQAAAIGTLGVSGLEKNPYSPFVPIAEKVLGPFGATVAITMLIISLILISNTAFMASARAIYTMAKDEQLPSVLGRLNKYGQPFLAIICAAIFNIGLIFLKTPILVLATAAFGYVLINGLSLLGFVLVRKDSPNTHRPFKAPKYWSAIALMLAIVNIPIYVVGIAWSSGKIPTILGSLILLTVIPLYKYAKYEGMKNF